LLFVPEINVVLDEDFVCKARRRALADFEGGLESQTKEGELRGENTEDK